MTRKRLAASVAAGVLVGLSLAPNAGAQECRRVVIFTLPGVIWEDVDFVGPENLLAAVEDGAAGSVSVRTVSSRTDYGDGFATIGAGNRVRVDEGAGAIADATTTIGIRSIGVRVSGFDAIEERADHDATGAEPGALGSALGDTPPIAIGNADLGKPPVSREHYGRWTLLAAMDRRGQVDDTWTGEEMLADDPTAPFGVRTDRELIEGAVDFALKECTPLVVDQGDLVRADALAEAVGQSRADERRAALLAADGLLGHIRASLDAATDLLLIVSPTSPAWDANIHLGVAVAVGPGYTAGTTLESASTRQAGIVTLPDVAPTVLKHLRIDRPSSMSGRAWTSVNSDRSDRIAAAIELDKESVFVLSIQADIATTFVIFQVAMYVVSVLLLRRRDAVDTTVPGGIGWLQVGALAVVAFPLSTYLATPIEGHAIGTAWFVAALIGIDAAVVTIAWLTAKRPLDRLLVVTACTVAVLIIDQVFGGRLQLNGVFGTLPIIAGRFTGLGNTAFTVLGTSALLTGALLVHRWPLGRWPLVVTATLFAVTVVTDGAPWLGSDVGGVVALVPALGITWVLLSGRKVTGRMVALAAAGVLVALTIFLALDFARPAENRTHFARLVEDVSDGGPDLLYDTIRRKVRANVRVFTSTIWTYLVPPAVGLMALLLLRPRGRWRQLAVAFPRLRAGLIGGLVLAVIGFFVNDSGIVIPAMALSFLVPMTLLVHLTMSSPPTPGRGVGEETA